MAAWDCGDSKRLWHNLSKPLSITYVDGEQPLELLLLLVLLLEQLLYLGCTTSQGGPAEPDETS